jgi:asparagine synthase (glutamine-hydrolysing)
MVRVLRPLRTVKPLGTAFRRVASPVLKRWTSPKYAGLLEYGTSYAGAYVLRRGLFMPWELPAVLDADLVRSGWQKLQPLASIEKDIADIDSAHLAVSCLESCWYMRNQLLRDADWAGMAHSLEIRLPLVDTELLRSTRSWLITSTPATKKILAHAPALPLPERVVSRRKTGFSIPVREWLLAGKKPNGGRGLRAWAKLVYGEFARA